MAKAVECSICKKELEKIDGMKITHETFDPVARWSVWLCAACIFTAAYDKPFQEVLSKFVKKREEIAKD